MQAPVHPRALALALVLTNLAPAAWAQDAQAGRAKAQACAVCHGQNGLSTAPDAPNLAGQPALYLARQLKAYQSGERRHEVMTLMARGLTADDVANLAAWYASISVQAQLPP